MRAQGYFLGVLLILGACERDDSSLNNSHQQDIFVQADTVEGKPLSAELIEKVFRLPRAAGIPYKVIPIFPKKDSEDYIINVTDWEKKEQLNWKIVFENLSEEQFKTLMKNYGGNKNVTYRAGATYELIDFLPPFIQALWGRRFVGVNHVTQGMLKAYLNERGPLTEEEPPRMLSEPVMTSASNCWGTAYEFARRSDSEFSTFWVNAYSITDYLNGSQYSSMVTPELGWSAELIKDKDGSVRNKDLKPGDILLIYFGWEDFLGSLQHAAVFVDDDLYFEKTGTAKGFLYRLVRFPQMTWPYGRDGDLLDRYHYVIVRHGEPGKEKLPHPSTVFGVNEEINFFVKAERPRIARVYEEGMAGGMLGGFFSLISNYHWTYTGPQGRAELEKSAYLTPETSGLPLLQHGEIKTLTSTPLKSMIKQSKDLEGSQLCPLPKGKTLKIEFLQEVEQNHALIQLTEETMNELMQDPERPCFNKRWFVYLNDIEWTKRCTSANPCELQ